MEKIQEEQLVGASVVKGHDEEEHKGEEINLFKASGVRNEEYWQCIRYIAPAGVVKKSWKSSDAIGVYCTICKVKLTYDSWKKSKGVKQHMDCFHSDLVVKHRTSSSNTNRKMNGGECIG